MTKKELVEKLLDRYINAEKIDDIENTARAGRALHNLGYRVVADGPCYTAEPTTNDGYWIVK